LGRALVFLGATFFLGRSSSDDSLLESLSLSLSDDPFFVAGFATTFFSGTFFFGSSSLSEPDSSLSLTGLGFMPFFSALVFFSFLLFL